LSGLRNGVLIAGSGATRQFGQADPLRPMASRENDREVFVVRQPAAEGFRFASSEQVNLDS
jgi:hypothetical protein